MEHGRNNHANKQLTSHASTILSSLGQKAATVPLPTRIAFVGNYLPRECGIATFTTDLCGALTHEYGKGRLFAIPVNDPGQHYEYPDEVRIEVEQDEIASYERAADFLNFNGNDLVCLQHEYGVYGGDAGSHILTLLRKLKMPIVTTLHTVLRDPDPQQRLVLEEIAGLSDRLVVMSELAANMLEHEYAVPSRKIDLIPHGVPELPFVDPNYYKDNFGIEGKFVLLTFGLLSPNKGIENVIRALPAILRDHPDVVYIVSGVTHPQIRRRDGEAYRDSLVALAAELGISEHLVLKNRFVSTEELMEHVGSADIYITPYRQEEQAVSGTLAIALGAGKAIVSTPYWHAKELLAEGRGMLVPFDDPDSISSTVNHLLENEAQRHAMRKRAYLFSRKTTWSNTARAYMASFQRARFERNLRPRPALLNAPIQYADAELPELNISHLRTMTDDTGILQHAIFAVPNTREGYTTDDNARALIVANLLAESSDAVDIPGVSSLSHRYLAFLWLAFDAGSGRFKNFLGYDRRWLENVGSEDSHGRALWSLGSVLGHSKNASLRGAAGRLFQAALPPTLHFTNPRSWAFCIRGVQAYLDWFPGDRALQGIRNKLADQLLDLYNHNHTDQWKWFEPRLTYSNATLSHALILVGLRSQNAKMLTSGLESLQWLMEVQKQETERIFVPIGSNGFYTQGQEKARFDQQPIEACSTVEACILAYQSTHDNRWMQYAQDAFAWFLGRNDLHVPLYDSATGGCRDGLHPDRVNENQGAESTLEFLMAFLALRKEAASKLDLELLEMSATH